MSPERLAAINQLLDKRQGDLRVVLENVHKPHNVAAIVRTCDAVGVHQIHSVTEGKAPLRAGTAMGAEQWVRNQCHEHISAAIHSLKAEGMQVLVTNLSSRAKDFRDIDYTQPTAIILGQERYGATAEAIELADADIIVPMVGMVQSLNVSVAAALILYEAQRQRQNAGMYAHPSLPAAERQKMLFEGGHPVLHQQCLRKGLPYPHIADNGEVIASDSWWQQLQYRD